MAGDVDRTRTVTLLWPPKELSPNARTHFHAKAKIAKVYREAAYWSAHGRKFPADALTLSITFYPPDKRKRDLDNMLSSIKAGLDGIADALGVNDERFALILRRAAPVKGGRVTVVIA